MYAAILQEYQAFLWSSFIVLLRVAPAIALTPAYGEANVPARVKMVLILAISVALAPIVEEQLPAHVTIVADLGLLIIFETIYGFFLGLVSRSVLFLLQHTANVINHSVSFAQITGNMTEPLPVLGHFFMVTALALITSGPLSGFFIGMIAKSYSITSVILLEHVDFLAAKLSEMTNFFFVHGVAMGMSFIALSFVYHLFIGFVSKTMPQFMVTFVGIPFVALMTMVFLLRTIQPVLTVWQKKAIKLLNLPLTDIL